ncbi:hypothetical protein [Mycolicibacterium goodii]|uniref:Mammalian cell entry protein n=1 Tax=Mycolicibacterium goodii TaxID=134601 RepID=A0ABS6HJ37_MYCGD|nr:hypothetical protein [Mycolicibacterium goodii]OKH64826.1 membrane protein [Mycobacterium sp. SWH-M5]MBU8810633.1 hypothetical protein [Mycolicibacterium goodii]MBU8818952.1 hypothetical protein [Mycolicibacterium goodii]MBU8822694.1 hypothetical protein [Mycolicibacterium goodii]MBU8829091.1 hypothetical protein [Mycolicibacterium goodii]
MPDAPGKDGPEKDPGERDDNPVGSGGIFSSYGVASAVLGVVAVVAVVLGSMIFAAHRDEVSERDYQTRVLQTAAEWANVLINMTAETVDADMQKLHEGTVGQLNNDFESAVQPYRELVQRLRSRTTGQIDSVAIESLYHPQPGPDGRVEQPERAELTPMVGRIDTVLVVATSVTESAGTDKPRTVRWNLRLDVADVDGQLMISRLEPIR